MEKWNSLQQIARELWVIAEIVDLAAGKAKSSLSTQMGPRGLLNPKDSSRTKN